MIETRDLTKTYGRFEALRGIDLQVEKGDVYGFIGPNGAGKTTTIRILTTLSEPTAGDAVVGGHSVLTEKNAIRKIIGYMPDAFGVYRDMTVDEYMHFFAAAYGIPHKERASLVGGLLELTDLSYKSSALIESLSRGMQQRLGLARTLVHDPQVLILDEPASGLDPRARIEIREILRELRRMGKTILLSSHILSEAEALADRISIIRDGRIVQGGTLEEMRRHTRTTIRAVLSRPPRTLAGLVPVHEGTLEGQVLTVALARGQINDAMATLSRFGITELSVAPPSLSDLFLRAYGEQPDPGRLEKPPAPARRRAAHRRPG